MSLVWMPAHDHAAFRRCPERRGHELPHRREDDCGVELLRRRPGGVAGPLRAELAREPLPGLVAGTREREHAPALVAGDLDHDVRGSAEAVQTETLPFSGEPERAVA